MLFPTVTFHEEKELLQITITPGDRGRTMLMLVSLGAIYATFMVFFPWLYLHDGCGFGGMWTGIGICSALYGFLLYYFLRYVLVREIITVDKDHLVLRRQAGFGTIASKRYSRSAISDVRTGPQSEKGTMLFVHEREEVRFGYSVHPEDAEELYRTLLRFFNRCGHMVVDENVVEVVPEELADNFLPSKRNRS